jgi:ArsR family transcriptional regulator
MEVEMKVLGGERMAKQHDDMAQIFKALCDPNRLIILDMLRTREKCACEILEELHISQSTLSHHMKVLCDSEIVVCESRGKWKYYSLGKQGLERAYHILADLMKCTEVEYSGSTANCE